jgi:hypothetical protein
MTSFWDSVINPILIQNFNTKFYNKIVIPASSAGYLNIVILAINHGANDFIWIAIGAASSGNMDMLQIAINHGPMISIILLYPLLIKVIWT